MMTDLRRARVWLSAPLVSAPLLVMAPSRASAQVVATSFQQLQPLVKSGDTIYVIDTNGRRTKGKLGALSASSLELLVRKTGPDGRETFVPTPSRSERDVREIQLERRDSILNGTLIGLAVGAGPWLVAGAIAGPGGGGCGSDSNICSGIGLIVGGIGAGIGALIDASLHERSTLYYQAPRQRSGVQVSPIVSQSVAGVRMSLRF